MKNTNYIIIGLICKGVNNEKLSDMVLVDDILIYYGIITMKIVNRNEIIMKL